MLAIRMQRVGRKGYPMYRLAVQEAQRHPTSGRVVAYVGSYNPHTKDSKVQVEDAQKYLDNGAQPSPRVVKLLKDAGVKMPSWVKKADKHEKTTRNADKLRKNRPVEKVVVEEAPTVEEAVEAPDEEVATEDAPVDETAVEETAPEADAPTEAEEVTEEK